jgi:hypothetical protein
MDTLRPGDLVLLTHEMSSTHRAFYEHHGVGLITKVGPAHPASDKMYCRVLFSKSQSRMEFLERDLKKITSPLDLHPPVLTFAVQDGDTK